MRVLLDECLPRKLKYELRDHEVFTVPEVGWSGIKNGDLLELAGARFDVLVTSDQNLEYQQNLLELELAILVLVAVSNDIEVLRPLMPEVRRILSEDLPLGTLMRIGISE